MTDLNPEQVRELRESAEERRQQSARLRDTTRSAQLWDDYVRTTRHHEAVIAVCDSWLARGEALAAAQRRFRQITESGTHTEAVSIANRAGREVASLSNTETTGD